MGGAVGFTMFLGAVGAPPAIGAVIAVAAAWALSEALAWAGGKIGEWLNDNLADLLRDILSDPLVLDLDGDGIELTALAGSSTEFDLDDDGVTERTGWVSPQDGLLVHDANGNGLADGVAELFGSSNVDGYDELATVDANGDGKIDASDPAFAELLIWRDLDGDGISTADEMLTLAQAGIARFNLAYTQSDTNVAGNIIARTGTYVRADGTSRVMGSLQFALDEATGRPEVPEGNLLGDLYILPNLAASGAAPDLRAAMYFDPVLRAMVEGAGANDGHASWPLAA